MKAAIIGAGKVGKMVFHDLQHVRMINEITLVGRNIDKVRAEVMDAMDAAALRGEYGPKLYYGGYEATKGADIILYAAGSSKLSEDRMELLHDNCVIAEEIFTEVKKYNRDAVIICITNPLDVIVTKIRQVMDYDPHKVIGTGTLLESARIVRFMAQFLELSDRSIQISVVGEHGNSATALVSSVRIMGLTLEEYMQSVTDESLKLNVASLNDIFKKEPFRIFVIKGYTDAGVSAAACKITAAIATDSREVMPVSSVLQGEYGVRDVAASVPSVIGRNGIEEIREAAMTDEERESFLASVDVIRKAAVVEGIVK